VVREKFNKKTAKLLKTKKKFCSDAYFGATVEAYHQKQ